MEQTNTAVPAPNAPLGRILSVSGSEALIGLRAATPGDPAGRITVGRLIRIECGNTLVLGVVTEMELQNTQAARDQGFHATAQIDLVGEIKPAGAGLKFNRGVTEYPAIGDPIALAGRAELQLIYQASNVSTVNIGNLQHDATIGMNIKVDDTISKHFAILGTTGVGKSTAVALILQKVMDARPDLRMFLIDVHNEYGQCFGSRAQILTPGNLRLPFWLFNFEETVDVIFGGRPGVEEEVEVLAEVIPLAKAAYNQYRNTNDRSPIKRADPKASGFTNDTPVPYRMADLLSLIDERMGKLENRARCGVYQRLMTRIETVKSDPRYAFTFDNANVGGDTMAEVIGNAFRLPANGVPMTIMQLAGFPAEVVDAVVSVLCRMAFDFGLWSEGAVPLLFVCEEAHRYASADRSIGFGPTRRAISRIAKEGRKYGVFLGLVTQRPAELDPTILSQCSTLFAMRMSNDRDQAILRSAISDAGSNLLAFLPSLGVGEVLAFGEGVSMPTRFKLNQLPNGMLRKGDSEEGRARTARPIDGDFVASVLEKWRGATMTQKMDNGYSSPSIAPEQSNVPAYAAAPAAGLDPDRFKLLKRPLDAAASAPPPSGSGRWPAR